MRGRNRKGPNPLARVYESNGPDVKIRGTASHVMEKYLTLARDAQSSGDPVAAENYLQHAEHYYRIIASAQQPMMPHQSQQPFFQSDDGREDDWDGGDDGRFGSYPDRSPNGFAGTPQPNGGGRYGGYEPQPYLRQPDFRQPMPAAEPVEMAQPELPGDALMQAPEAAPAQSELQPVQSEEGGLRRPRRRGRYQRGERRQQGGETPAGEPVPAD